MTGIERWEKAQEEFAKAEYYRKADERVKNLRARLSQLMADNAEVLREIESIKRELNPPNPFANAVSQLNDTRLAPIQGGASLIGGLFGRLGGALG